MWTARVNGLDFNLIGKSHGFQGGWPWRGAPCGLVAEFEVIKAVVLWENGVQQRLFLIGTVRVEGRFSLKEVF